MGQNVNPERTNQSDLLYQQVVGDKSGIEDHYDQEEPYVKVAWLELDVASGQRKGSENGYHHGHYRTDEAAPYRDLNGMEEVIILKGFHIAVQIEIDREQRDQIGFGGCFSTERDGKDMQHRQNTKNGDKD